MSKYRLDNSYGEYQEDSDLIQYSDDGTYLAQECIYRNLNCHLSKLEEHIKKICTHIRTYLYKSQLEQCIEDIRTHMGRYSYTLVKIDDGCFDLQYDYELELFVFKTQSGESLNPDVLVKINTYWKMYKPYNVSS